MSDPGVLLRQIAMGMRASRALHAAAVLGLADHLAPGVRGSVELAELTGTDPAALHRLLRALSALGIFAEREPGCFSLTEAGERLCRGHPQSVHAAAVFLAGDLRWSLWSDLLGCLRTGAAAADRVLGHGIFEHYAAYPEEGEIAQQAMLAFTEVQARAVVAAYDFSHRAMVADIGGGTGGLLASILAANPTLSGILFDLPHVIRSAAPILAARGVAERCRCVAGSVFDGVPAGADTYLLKQVVHDWDDERTQQILASCHAAMHGDARLLVIERVMPERSTGASADAFLLDLEMLVATGGRERTLTEYQALLATAGFSLLHVIPTGSPVQIIEAALATPRPAHPN